jgi:aminoglycoside phosphotransferase (APT) family kinase protein
MHADQVHVDEDLVRALVRDQFPTWADLIVRPVASYGTEHAIYRLGDRLSGRFPLVGAAEAAASVERRWLPVLRPFLPCGIPVVLARGAPAFSYPFSWAVYEWLPGEDGSTAEYDERRLAVDLAGFVKALQSVDTSNAPRRPRGHRGGPLADVDAAVRRAIRKLGGRIDSAAVTESWEESLHATGWDRPDVWVHGDLLPGNLLFCRGKLTAVIDFGGLSAGDPASDLQPAWNVFSGDSRRLFRRALGVDDATWLRGRGWTVYQAVTGLSYYWDTNPRMIRQVSHALGQVLSD